MSLGEAELLLLLSCNSWGGGGGLICSASIEVAEAVAVLLQILSFVKDNYLVQLIEQPILRILNNCFLAF